MKANSKNSVVGFALISWTSLAEVGWIRTHGSTLQRLD